MQADAHSILKSRSHINRQIVLSSTLRALLKELTNRQFLIFSKKFFLYVTYELNEALFNKDFALFDS